MTQPRMFYFGPYKSSGHFMVGEGGKSLYNDADRDVPWRPGDIDGQLQPDDRSQEQGRALVHYRDGWTALSFWDRTIDTRMGCNSTFIAEGTFDFGQMVTMSKERFADRWGLMKFEVTEAPK